MAGTRFYPRHLRRSAFVRLAVSVGLVAGVVVAAAAPASASPVWSVAASPSPFGPSSGHLVGVACPSATSCFAVGTDLNFNGTLVERWNGTSWSIVTSPTVQGELNGVSCASTTS